MGNSQDIVVSEPTDKISHFHDYLQVCTIPSNALYNQGIIQAVFEVGNRFWVHQNLHQNFDELAKSKNIKPHC